jgi:hypothetical protein
MPFVLSILFCVGKFGCCVESGPVSSFRADPLPSFASLETLDPKYIIAIDGNGEGSADVSEGGDKALQMMDKKGRLFSCLIPNISLTEKDAASVAVRKKDLLCRCNGDLSIKELTMF